jgi:hypothetical protein
MESKKSIIKTAADGYPSKVYATSKNKRYLIGYEDGKLELRTSTNFAIEDGDTIEDLGHIVDIISDDATYIIVSTIDGEIFYLDMTKNYEKTTLQEKTWNPEKNCYAAVTSIKVTADNKTLIGY